MRAWLLCAYLVAYAVHACPGLSAHEPWIRETPPGAKMLAGFGTLRNMGPDALKITGVRSPYFSAVTLHETRFENGTARMLEVKTLAIKAGDARVLKPGGLHLMLMMPKATMRAGDSVELEFICGESRATFDFPLKAPTP